MRCQQLNGENMVVQLNVYTRQVRQVVSCEGLTGLGGPWGRAVDLESNLLGVRLRLVKGRFVLDHASVLR